MRDFLVQINTGRGCEWGPLWRDINPECVNVSHAIQKHKHPHFLGESLPPVVIHPATFYKVKQGAVYFFPLSNTVSVDLPLGSLRKPRSRCWDHIQQFSATSHQGCPLIFLTLKRQETTLCVLTVDKQLVSAVGAQGSTSSLSHYRNIWHWPETDPHFFYVNNN